MKHEKQKKKGLFNGALVKLAAVAVFIGCAVLIVTTNKDCETKEEQMARIQTKIDAYETENAELQRVLDSDDLKEYMEKVALEERGYAYPDERRFYDTTRD
ncbi:hypothetical protein [Ruminococcus flavefaciens]|jgi:hypothetical protein|uniref:Septum formation initiator n=1 Tax=Ruminococcus flavefaciens TaxID=1265 RepID=A0A1K1PKU6_RUMFL|nr:hypothetical protein [Ruminococcus flavefaciens]SFW48252.1 hypothetical protein SAMN02910280_2839 [Ruminococcus flavefaciens]